MGINVTPGSGRIVISGGGGGGGVPAPTTIPGLESGETTMFLTHMDGTNGSTTFTDVSLNKYTLTNSGATSVQVSTAQSKFGGASALFSGNNQLTSAGAGFAFGTGNFTMECWVYPTNSGFGTGGFSDYGGTLLDTRVSGGSSGGVLVILSNTGKVRMWSGSLLLESTTGVSLNAWTHVALVRSSGTCTFYINGTAAGSTSVGSNFDNTSFLIGAPADHANSDGFLKHIGHMDEVRISSAAKYTSNFTPAAAAFPGADSVYAQLPSPATVGQVVYADVNKNVAYICDDASTPLWTRYAR